MALLRSVSNQGSTSRRLAPLVLFADLLSVCGPGDETVNASPDQGERVFFRELGSRLRARVPTVLYSSSRESSGMVEQVPGNRLISPKLAGRLWRHRPRAIVYLYPITVGALVRARLLRLFGHGAPVAMIALASHPLGRLGRAFGRLLGPKVVLVASEAERRRLRSVGRIVDTLPVGVDVQRFRPPEPGEKQRLRRSWGLPVEGDVVLHVGHLVRARNLQVLTALAARTSITPVLLASHVRDSGSQDLLDELRRAGVVVLEGYQPGVEELYRAVDCYVFTSRAWGGGIEMPLSVLEALASDLPVASTLFGALPERFENSDGVRFATSDEDLIEMVVRQVRERPHTRHLVEQYSWDAVADRVLSLLGYQSGPGVAVAAEAAT
jgi:glycosyltransferase involved in cell wall biosynthesis